MDVDFIKWMVGYAEGFELFDLDAEFFINEEEGIIVDKSMRIRPYPLLLQRAIEGVNNSGGCASIDQDSSTYWIFYEDLTFQIDILQEVENIDQAKESALRYIYEQEGINI